MPTPYNTLLTPSKEFDFQTRSNQTGIGIISFKMVQHKAKLSNITPTMPLRIKPLSSTRLPTMPEPTITMPLRTMDLPITINNNSSCQGIILEMLLVKILNLA